MKRAPKSLWILLGLLCFVGILEATLPQTVTGTWTSAANLSIARSNPSSVLLSDGRILIIGGDGANGPVQAAEVFATDGTVSSAAALNVARSRHFAVMLKDGRVLVGGGITTGGGTTNSAEIYDPSSDSWSQISAMSEARAGATAALLQDGRVVIAGGDNSGTPSNTLEIYDPASGNFSFAGTLSSARTKHAMSVLPGGNVLIVGGFDGTNALASSDIFDPSAGTVTPGPSMATARYSHSATALLDGRVLIAGGITVGANGTVELASAESFDPVTAAFTTSAATLATARQGHQAFLLPNNNNVLIVGGVANGQPIAASELYSPWQDAFAATGANVTPRSGATGSAMKPDGLLLAAGGTDASSNALASTELYAFPTVKTDQDDYAPWTTVTITGSGWKPGETVTLTLVESPLIDTHPVMKVVADGNGNIINTQFSPDDHDENIRFYLSAVGSQSGLQAQNTFTDSQPTAVVLNPSSITVVAGGSAAYTVTVQHGGNNTACDITLSVPNPIATGASGSFSTPNPFTMTNADVVRTMTIPTTNSGPPAGRTPAGTYPFTVTAARGANCQGNGNVTTNGNLIVAGSATHFTVAGFSLPTTAGTSQSFTVTALDSNNNTAIGYTGTVHFTSSDGQAVLPANYAFTGADNGVHSFNATLKTIGTQSITATDTVTGTITGTQSGIVVNAGPTATLLVSGYPSPVIAGTSNAFTVTAQDAFGNLTAGYVGTVHFTSSDGAAVLPANHTFSTGTGSKDNGVAAFNATFNTAGTQSIIATDTANVSIAGTQSGVVVNSATVNSTTTVTSSLNPSIYGTLVTFTTTVTRASGTTTPTGTVAIKDGATTICTTGNLTGSAGTASASCAVSNLSVVASPHSITAVYAGDSNFNGSTSSAISQVVNAKALTVSGIAANNKPYDGTTTATLNTGAASLVGVVSGDTVTFSTAGTTGAFTDKNVGTAKTVTIAGLTIGGASAGNYTLTQPTTTADITAVALTASIIGNPTKVYDGNTNATLTTPNFSVSGTIGTESLSVTQTAGTYNSKDVATATTVTATLTAGDFVPGPGTSSGNYIFPASASGAGQITAKTLTAAIVGNPTKNYDGMTASTLTSANFSLTGLVAGESITVTQTAGTYNTKDVLTAHTVTASLSAANFTAGAGTLLSNYTMPTTASGAGQITPRTLQVTAHASNKTYDATTTASATLSDDHLGSDAVTVGFTSAAFSDKNVANGKTVTVSGLSISGGADAGNYTLNGVTHVTTTANITPRPLNVNATGVNKQYDGSATATVSLSDDRISGDVIIEGHASANFLDKNVGNSKPISVTGISISGTDSGNYALQNTTANTTANITPRPLTVSATGTNKVYDGNTSATVTLSDDRVSGDSLTDSYTSASFVNKNVGTGKAVSVNGISISGADSGNYALQNTTASTTADITARPLTITATGVNKIYDGATTASVTLSDDRIAGDVFTDSYATANFNDKNVGSPKAITVSGISISGADAGNYTFNATASAQADITPRALTVSATGVDKVYDGTNAASVSLSDNRISGDSLTDSYASATFTDKSVGSDKPISVTGITISGGDAGNYSLQNSTVSTTANITPRPLTVSATGVDKMYDGTAAATVTLSDDRLSGDSFSDSYTSASFADRNVGNDKSITVNGISISGADVGNYSLQNTTANATANIMARPLTISATGINKVYDGTNTATVTLSDSRIAGDVFTDSYTSASFGDKNVGIGKPVSVSGISISGADAGNYTFNTTASANADISARHITMKAATDSKTYDGNTASTAVPTLVSGSLAPGDGANFTQVFDSRNAGARTLTPSGSVNDGNSGNNYAVTLQTATGSIAPLPITVAAASDTKTYDGNTNSTGTPTVTPAVISPDTANYTQAFDSRNAGPRTLSPTGSINDGNGGNNYSVTTHTAAGTINKAPLTITAVTFTKTYDGNTSATGAMPSVSGLQDVDTVTGLSERYTGPNAGTGKTLTVNAGYAINDGNGGNNYTVSLGDNTTGVINKANATTQVTPYSVTYDGAPHTATGTAKGVLNESLSGLSLTGTTHTNAGNYTDSWTFTDSTGNYNNSSSTVNDMIGKANATINVTPYNVAYDGNPHTATGTAKGVLNENLSGLSLSATTHTNPGDYPTDNWTFTDVTGNYNNANGTVHDAIGYGTCSVSIGPGQVILPPINSDGTSVYPRKGSSTIPVKFRVCSASGASISNASLVFAGTGGSLTMLSAVRGTIDSVNEAGNTDVPDAAFRWDSSGQQWMFNMATTNLSSGQTYTFRINLANGSIAFVVGVK